MSGSNRMACEGDDAPDLTIGPISIFIVGRPYPDADHAFDRDAITCSATARMHGISARLADGCIYGFGLLDFWQNIERLYETLSGEAVFDASDLGLTLRLRALGHGHIALESQLHPHSSPETRWEMTLVDVMDQTFLPEIMGQCRTVLRQYPVQFIPRPLTPATAET